MRAAAVAALAALLLALPSTTPAQEERVIPGGREADILALAAPIALGAPVAGGYRLGNIRIDGQAFTFILEGERLEPVELRVAPAAEAPGYRADSSPPQAELAPAARAAVERLRGIVLARVDAAFWDRVLVLVAAAAPPRPRPPSAALAWAVTLVAFVAIVVLEAGAGARHRRVVAALLVAIVPLLVWHLQWGGPGVGLDAGQNEEWFQERERHLVQLALSVAMAALAAAALVSLRRVRRGGLNAPAALDAALVLAWSVAVRFGLTTANVLTDGGSGWSRLLGYRRGFSGLAVLVALVLPDRSMSDAILVPRLLAALSPPVLVLLAGVLRARRTTAAFAGLALASLPLHAALYSSDFESGAVTTFLLAALALVGSSSREVSPTLLAAGLALLGYALWGRPEALVVGLPLLVLAWGLPRQLWRRPAVVAAVVWLGGLAVLRIASLQGLAHGTRQNFYGPWSVLPFGELLTTTAILPFWLWLPLPLGLAWLGGRARAVALSGLLAGLLPVHATPTMFDPTGTYLEFFRYATFALPWLALLASAGLAGLAERLGKRFRSPVGAKVPALAVVLVLVATPLVNRDYLALRYGPVVDGEVFREALTRVPQECTLVVPDDAERAPAGSLDVAKRYAEIAHEVSAPGSGGPRLVELSTFLRAWEAAAAAGQRGMRGCWFFYRGSYCHDGLDGDPPAACREVLDRVPFEKVWSREVEYRSHRLVSRPKRLVAPWYDPRLELSLYRLTNTSP
jgi:hypothetical protein